MVVAEVPLWVVHTNSHQGGAASLLGTSNNAAAQKQQRAQQSLGLLQNKQKCAIYSLDLHPHKPVLATAGGDGTVRLWSTLALFAPSSKTKKQQQQHTGGSYDQDGAYVSTSAASSGGEESSSAGENGGGYSSAGVEEDAVAAGGEVHDLNSAVRRKKDGLPSPHKQTATAGAASSPSSPNTKAAASPQQRSRSSSKHHRLICTLSAHTGSSVLAVRFAPSGKFLASAGDDAVVCIYAPNHAAGGLTSFGTTEGANQQHWSRIKLCRGHTLDVVDLAWAPDDSHLVSCSLDSETPIIVWKLSDLLDGSNNKSSMICNPYKVLGRNIHTSTVKGVAFDPAGSYLASSGDDPAVCIWRAHDDWGLETRIDADAGIFRSWKNSGDDDVQALSNQSMFRRLSWSTDGAFLCATNAVVKNKHVASTISREGWSVSSGKPTDSNAGAANLVGHKQPVVVSRHAAQLLNARRKKQQRRGSGEQEQNKNDDENAMKVDNDDDDGNEEPESATLLALGDRRGFVTVWSTRKSRPLFKLQCSESRCTVTDLAWGRTMDRKQQQQGSNDDGGDMMLLVSLMDGQVVALKFSVPDEIGPFLSSRDHGRVFQLRYGIDMMMGDDDDGGSRRRLLVGQTTGGTRLIENALQMTLEEDEDDDQQNDHQDDDDNDQDDDMADNNPFVDAEMGDESMRSVNELASSRRSSISDQQQESRSQSGKKRVRPVLMTVSAAAASQQSDKRPREQQPATAPSKEAPADPMQVALEAAEKTSAAAESAAAGSQKQQATTADSSSNRQAPSPSKDGRSRGVPSQQRAADTTEVLPPFASVVSSVKIPHDASRVKTVDLPDPVHHVQDPLDPDQTVQVAECANNNKVPTGSQGTPIPCIDLVIKRNNRVTWRDQIPGTSCSAVVATRSMLVVGTTDGCLYLFGNSPSMGWTSGLSFRSHPPLVVGGTIVRLRLEHRQAEGEEEDKLVLLVVTADAAFAVYTILPTLSLQYKGSILPAMTHMALAASISRDSKLPQLSRVQITESGRLLLLLSSSSSRPGGNERNGGTRVSGRKAQSGVGGSLQAFVYDRPTELWMRVSDSRFALSDFYSSLPSSRSGRSGQLTQMEDAVKLGSLQSPLESSHRNRYESQAIYNNAEDQTGSNYVASRGHCEDRMACAVALGSASEFKLWLSRFVRTLSVAGNASQLRMLVDMLLGSSNKTNRLSASNNDAAEEHPCWWLSSTSELLDLDRKSLVRSVISEMSKNRSLQRLTNEIALELENL